MFWLIYAFLVLIGIATLIFEKFINFKVRHEFFINLIDIFAIFGFFIPIVNIMIVVIHLTILFIDISDLNIHLYTYEKKE